MPDGLKTALVTGGARRIGAAIVRGLAADGWAVAIHCHRSRKEAETLKGELGGQAAVISGDLTEPSSAERIVADAAHALGGLTLLVNNASIFEPDEIGSVTDESWARHLDTNLRAPVFLAQAFAARLPAHAAGNIVNIIDQRVWKPTPQFFSYTIGKSALWTATRTMAQALAPRIRVNAIAPGPALPSARMTDDDLAKQARATLLGRGTSPEEIAAAVKFILNAPALTGQMIALDGGQHLAWRTADVTDVEE